MRLSNNLKAAILSVLIVASSVMPSDANNGGGLISEFLHNAATSLVQEIVQGVQYLTAP